MPVAGAARNFHLQPFFEVQIDGMKSVEFAEVDGLEQEIGRIIHREGGGVNPISIPGLVKEKTLTLKRGQTGDLDLWLWFSTVVQMTAAGLGSANFGLANGLYRRNLDIVNKDRDESVLRRWGVAGCWPMKYKGGQWNAKTEEVVMEEITLSYDYADITI